MEIDMEIISIRENRNKAVKRMREAIEGGELIIYPTDTLYGIGGNALDKKVVDKIYKIKGRNKNNPLSIIVRDLEMAGEFCTISPKEKRKLKKYTPGPYTLLLKMKKRKLHVSRIKRLAIRIPENSFIRKVMEKLDVPLISTSANFTGDSAPSSFKEIPKNLMKKVDLVVDGGETKYKHPSTVIDLPTGKILRDFRGK